MVHVDFETRSKFDLKKGDAFSYAKHPSTEVMFLCWSYDDSPKVYTWFFKNPMHNFDKVLELIEYLENGGILKAHNAEFEFAIWNYSLMRQLLKLKKIKPYYLKIKQLRCSAAEAAYLTLPRKLQHLAEALKTRIQKDMTGNQKMLKLSKPRKPTKNNPSIWHEDPDDFKIVGSYCIDDVRVEKLCSKKLIRLPEKELALYHLTVKMNERGMRIDKTLARKANEFRRKFEAEMVEELKSITNNRVYSVNQHAKYKAEVLSTGYDMPNLQAETVEEALQDKSCKGKARRLLELRQMLAKSSLAKYDKMLASVCDDDRVRGTQLYYGATTGRWAGRGMQPHNFPKSFDESIPQTLELLKVGDYELFKALQPNVYDSLSNCLRSMIIAKPGHTFIDVDWNAIEARVVLWLAGDEEGLQTYYKGIDAYKELAALVLEKTIEEVTKQERQYIGKPGVLGCGYGMGYKKMAAKENIEEKLAFKIVKTWRRLHKPVKTFWRDLENAAIAAVLKPGKVQKAGPHIHFKYSRQSKFLMCKLPSGRILYYIKPRVKNVVKKIEYEELETLADGSEKFVKRSKIMKQKELYHIIYKGSRGFPASIHGAHICENVSQATARDIVAEAMLRTDNTEFEQTLSLHDEIKCEVPKEKANVEKFLKIMDTPVEWAEGLPLKTEAWVGRRFRA